MSIFPYQDIHPHHDHHGHCGHHFDPSYALETSKNVDICDKFGRLKYSVSLSSCINAPGMREYKVTVSQVLSGNIETFMQIPDGEDMEPDRVAAMCAFDTCVKKYQSLVDAETRDFRDINVYSENIGYSVQEVECCSNCKWCMKTKRPSSDYWPNGRDKVTKLQCCCPMNQQVFNYAQDFPQPPSAKPHSAWQKLPWQKPEDICSLAGREWDPREFPSIVFPAVEPLGRCDNYESGNGFAQYGPPFTPAQYQIAKSIAKGFDSTEPYDVGDLVYYGGKLYQCRTQHEAGPWNDGADFMPVTVSDAVKFNASALSGMYVRSDALSGHSLPENPTQRQIATEAKYMLSALGGEVEGL